MTIYSAYQERKTRDAYEDTWGHLRPEPGKKYDGWILFTYTCYGDIVIIDWDFGELPASPWQCSDFINFIVTYSKEIKTPGVFRWTGWYKRFKNERCHFGNGKFEVILESEKNNG